jgi:hypothetical protein
VGDLTSDRSLKALTAITQAVEPGSLRFELADQAAQVQPPEPEQLTRAAQRDRQRSAQLHHLRRVRGVLVDTGLGVRREHLQRVGHLERSEPQGRGAERRTEVAAAGDDDHAAGAGRQQLPDLVGAAGSVQQDQDSAVLGHGPEQLRACGAVGGPVIGPFAQRVQETVQDLAGVALGSRDAEVGVELCVREVPRTGMRVRLREGTLADAGHTVDGQ